MKNKKNLFDLHIFLMILLSCLIIFILGLNIYRAVTLAFGETKIITTTVTEKGIKRITNNNFNKDIYLVYTQTDSGEINVFQISDSLLAGRFDSSDVYAGITVGKKYEFTYRGDRNRFLSWYPNIYGYMPVN